MQKGFCQSVVGLKKSFDAEVGDTVSQVKATIRFSCPITEAGVYHEKPVVILTQEEYNALTSGKDYLVPHSFVLGLETLMDSLRTVIAIVQDLSNSAKGKE